MTKTQRLKDEVVKAAVRWEACITSVAEGERFSLWRRDLRLIRAVQRLKGATNGKR